MSIKKLTADKRNKLIIVASATVVIAVGLWFTLIESQNASIAKLANRNAEEKQKLESARRLLASKPEIDRRLEKVSTKLTSIEQEMVKGDMYDWVIQTVKTFKGPYRDRIEIPNFSREVLGDVLMFPKFPYRSALYNIRGTAYYHDLGRFIADFENRFPFIRIQNLELEPAANSSATATEDVEKLAFKFEVVALVSPTQP